MYSWVAVAPGCAGFTTPSPKSNVYEAIGEPPASVDPDASAVTLSGAEAPEQVVIDRQEIVPAIREPLEMARQVLRITGGSRLGVSIADVGADDVAAKKLPSQSGALVQSVEDASAAAKAGIKSGDVIVEFGHQADHVYLIAHGKVNKVGIGQYGDQTVLGTLADGDYFGDQSIVDDGGIWEYTVKAVTPCTVLSLPRSDVERMADQSEQLRAHIERVRAEGHHLREHALDIGTLRLSPRRPRAACLRLTHTCA